jgi:CheY-like chemotaxis protein
VLNANVKLLIVDNDPSIRFSLCEIFRCMGHTVRSAEDGTEALEEMAAAMPDVLLSDIEMPRMSGLELLSIVRRRFPSVYVIAMSATHLRSLTPNGISADGFYEKASGVVALLQAVSDGAASNRMAVWAYRKSMPVILERGESTRFAEPEIFLGCPECLRAFPQPMGANASRMETSCVHCRAVIHCAAVEQYSGMALKGNCNLAGFEDRTAGGAARLNSQRLSL